MASCPNFPKKQTQLDAGRWFAKKSPKERIRFLCFLFALVPILLPFKNLNNKTTGEQGMVLQGFCASPGAAFIEGMWKCFVQLHGAACIAQGVGMISCMLLRFVPQFGIPPGAWPGPCSKVRPEGQVLLANLMGAKSSYVQNFGGHVQITEGQLQGCQVCM